MSNSLKTFSTRQTPQNEKADSRQVKNNAGGYTFEISDEQRLRRFLVLGTDSGTYYASAQALTRQNGEFIVDLAQRDHAMLRRVIRDVSLGGKAPKQDATLFALAIASSFGTDADKREALGMLSDIARTGTHLFQFVDFVQQFRGWGRGLVRGVSDWYTDKDADRMAFQAVKYRNRNGWTHRDVLRKAHPLSVEPSTRATFDWIVNGSVGEHTPRIIEGFLKAQETGANIPALIGQYGLTWEMLPTQALTDAKVWAALLDKGMPMTALIRNLPRLTNLGLLTSGRDGYLHSVIGQITSEDALKKARVHPLNLLNAHMTYAAGRSQRGSSEWTPNAKVIDALDAAFYKAFDFVEPSGARILNGVDISGSMVVPINGMALTAADASIALAMVQTAVEDNVTNVAFTASRSGGSFYRTRKEPKNQWNAPNSTQRHSWSSIDGLSELSISPRQRLRDAVQDAQALPMGDTDCALPMLYALDKGLEVDLFTVMTDNETWAGTIQPHQALKKYREQTGIDAKMVVVGMTATDFSIADPTDAGMLDVVGMDTATPQLISEFAKGL